MPDNLRLAKNVVCFPIFPETEAEEKIEMGQKTAAQIFPELNLSLSARDIKQGLQSLHEQEAARKAANKPSDKKAELRRALLNAIRALDIADDPEDLAQCLQAVRVQLGGVDDDELSTHGRRYDIRGGLLQWTPERKPSTPPKF
jgi:hypothetical protein